MNYINRYLQRMAIFLILVGVVIGMLHQPLWKAFMNSPYLNGLIFGVLFFGIGYAFYQLFSLRREIQWINSFAQQEFSSRVAEPKILAPLAALFTEAGNVNTLSSLTVRSLLTSIEMRLDEVRDITRYLIGLLIFLGLLGTFWGLSQTIGAIAGVISGLDIGSGDVTVAFQDLKNGLKSPLLGMGTAFSSSMFGLAGSLILGFLDLQTNKGSTSFFHDLEERLTAITRVGPGEGEIEHGGPAYTQSLLEQATENMGQLQLLIRRSEDNRTTIVKSLQGVSERLSLMADQSLTQQALLKKIAQNQIELQGSLEKLTSLMSSATFGIDEGVKRNLRNMDTTTIKLLEELVEGRTRSTQELRNEIRLIARTLSAIANGREAAA